MTIEIIDTIKLFKDEREQLNESGDCTVRALACLADIDYLHAHKVVSTEMNRSLGEGAWLDRYLDKLSVLKGKIITPEIYGLRYEYFYKRQHPNAEVIDKGKKGWYIKDFVKSNPEGSFLVMSRGHAFAVIDGKIYGNKNDDRKYLHMSLKIS